MIEKTTGAPAQDPVITIAGAQYTLRFSFLAQYQADVLAVNLPQFLAGLATSNTGTLSTFVRLLAAMVAHNFAAANKPVPSPDQWASLLDREPRENRQAIFSAIGEVLSAWLKEQAPAAVRLQETAPAQGPPLPN